MSSTILFTETRKDIPWSAPVDITLESLERGIITGKPGEVEEGIGSHHLNGQVNVLLVDGNVKVLEPSTSPEILKRLAIVNDGEPVVWDEP